MSRSYWHTPIAGVAGHRGSNKPYRSYENRAKRRRVQQLLIMHQFEKLPHEAEYGNEWCSPRDGKMYFGELAKESYKCWVCRMHKNFWPYSRQCYCAEYKQEYKELMRK